MFSKLLVVSALASAVFAADCTRSYTVKEGDICDSIGKANNVSTYQLSTVNAEAINDACTNLEIGQVLCLGTAGQDCNIVHTVVAGDTCDKVMQGAAINATMLYANNPQIDEYCSNIYIGEVLCVANQVLSPAEVSGRIVGAAGGEPAGPPAPTPYPEAKPKPKPAATKAAESTSAAPTSTEPSSTTQPPVAAAVSTPTSDDDDDANLPECEDPNDDGYW